MIAIRVFESPLVPEDLVFGSCANPKPFGFATLAVGDDLNELQMRRTHGSWLRKILLPYKSSHCAPVPHGPDCGSPRNFTPSSFIRV
jgi:hypothetical protein